MAILSFFSACFPSLFFFHCVLVRWVHVWHAGSQLGCWDCQSLKHCHRVKSAGGKSLFYHNQHNPNLLKNANLRLKHYLTGPMSALVKVCVVSAMVKQWLGTITCNLHPPLLCLGAGWLASIGRPWTSQAPNPNSPISIYKNPVLNKRHHCEPQGNKLIQILYLFPIQGHEMMPFVS